MQFADLNNPGERKKLIWAIALGVLALIFLWWTFIGFGGSSKPTTSRNTPAPRSSPTRPLVTTSNAQKIEQDVPLKLIPVHQPIAVAFVPEAKRNIFAYAEKPVVVAQVPTPTPTPTPPLLLASLSPANVYARTDEFTLEATGDKFTPEVRITIDGQTLPTRFLGPQQLSVVVPAALIANPGNRQVSAASADGKLYSNVASLNVNPPPTPNFSYIGLIKPTIRPEIALLQDRGNREVLNVQRGDVVGGRFRLTSISEKELVFVDTNLKIKHTLAVSTGERGLGPQSRPTPKVDSEDDEP